MDNSIFGDLEAQMLDSNYKLRNQPDDWPQARLIASLHSLSSGDMNMEIEQLGIALRSCAKITTTKLPTELELDDWFGETNLSQVSAVYSSKQSPSVTAQELSKKWNVGLEKAENTIQVTTQQGVRSLMNPHIS